MEESSQRIRLNQSKKEIQNVLNVLDLKLIRNPLKKSQMHSQILHKDLAKNMNHLGVPMHVLVMFRMVEDLNYDNLVEFWASYCAEEFGTTTSHIAGSLRRLEKKGFICRLWDPANESRRVRIWMFNPTVIYRGNGYNYQRALDNYEALMDGRYEDTIFDRDKSETSSLNRRIPWLQGTLNFKEKKIEVDEDELRRKRSAS
jgi:DNA-binding MarR family transcriptional regulator